MKCIVSAEFVIYSITSGLGVVRLREESPRSTQGNIGAWPQRFLFVCRALRVNDGDMCVCSLRFSTCESPGVNLVIQSKALVKFSIQDWVAVPSELARSRRPDARFARLRNSKLPKVF
jgi:hypothetical protein